MTFEAPLYSSTLVTTLLQCACCCQVGVMWHVECGDGIFFPFSRGCSFITLSQDGTKIQTVRAQGGVKV